MILCIHKLNFQLRFLKPALLFWAALILPALMACAPDGDYQRVDFTVKAKTPRSVDHDTGRDVLRVAVAAMVSPKETFIYYRELVDYLGAKLDHDVILVQRRTYGEINDMLAKGQIDLAFTCTGPYVVGSKAYGFTAVATPVIRGEPFYRSYLIVHEDSTINSFGELEGKRFAFTDPESNTGTLVPRYWLKQTGRSPETFFQTFTYTYSHDNSILAVAKKLVDGAAVDEHIWEYYRQRSDFYAGKTRVIQKSEPFGSPPLVIADTVTPQVREKLVRTIMSMHEDPQGATILTELMIDRFARPQTAWYTSVQSMLDQVGQSDGTKNAAP